MKEKRIYRGEGEYVDHRELDLSGSGESDCVLAEIVHGVVFPEEDISDDPDRTERSWDVKTSEGAEFDKRKGCKN